MLLKPKIFSFFSPLRISPLYLIIRIVLKLHVFFMLVNWPTFIKHYAWGRYSLVVDIREAFGFFDWDIVQLFVSISAYYFFTQLPNFTHIFFFTLSNRHHSTNDLVTPILSSSLVDDHFMGCSSLLLHMLTLWGRISIMWVSWWGMGHTVSQGDVYWMGLRCLTKFLFLLVDV